MNATTTTTATGAPATVNEKTVNVHHDDAHVLRSPLWLTIIRGFQVFLSFVILALAARLMHDAYLDEAGLALAISILTWIAVAYILLTENIPSWRGAYHIIAVLCLDGLMMVLWLATFAAAAAQRAAYKYNTTVDSCFDDGSAFNSKFCFRKRQLEKRDEGVILFKSGLAILAAIAGLGALVWLLFIAAFVWTLIMFIRGRKQGRFPLSSTTGAAAHQESHQMESTPVDPNQIAAAHAAPHAQQTQMQTGPLPAQQPYAPSQSPYPQTVSPQPGSDPYSPPVGAYSPETQASQPAYGQYPPHHQQGYQPPTSPSPLEQNSQLYQQDGSQVGQYPQHTGSPAPQELHPEPYRPQPQEMPPNAPAHQQQQ